MYNPSFDPNQSTIAVHNFGVANIDNWNYPEELVTTFHWRCYLNDSDGALLWHGIKKIPMSKNYVYLIAPETPFNCASTQPFKQLYFHFSLDNVDDLQMKNFIQPIPVWTEAIAFMHEAQIKPARLSKRQILFASLSFLYRALAQLPGQLFEVEDKIDPRIKIVLKMLDTTLLGHYSNKQLAEKIGMSENGFVRFFSKSMGKPPQAYYRELRIERGSRLLRNSNHSVERIAQETGFVDRYHFSRVFRQIMGENPGAYRKRKE